MQKQTMGNPKQRNQVTKDLKPITTSSMKQVVQGDGWNVWKKDHINNQNGFHGQQPHTTERQLKIKAIGQGC
jgi:hypothetical protein